MELSHSWYLSQGKRGSRSCAALAFLFSIGLLVVPIVAEANPFETISKDHWAYRQAERLVDAGLVNPIVRDRLRLRESLTYFDFALWTGQALERLLDAAPVGVTTGTLAQWADWYNQSEPPHALGDGELEALRELVSFLGSHLEVLGYPIPSDLKSGQGRDFDNIASALNGFRLQGESRIRYQDVESVSEKSGIGSGGGGSQLDQSYSLRLSGAVTSDVNVGAEVRGATRHWTDEDPLTLDFGGLDVGFSRSGIARFGEVSGAGFSDLAVGDGGPLQGVEARVRLGQVGSSILVASLRPDDGDLDAGSAASGQRGFVAAWDGSVQLNEQLSLDATVARLGGTEGRGPTEGEENLIFSLGGTYAATPRLTLSGEMAQSSSADGGAGALKVGAVLHPLPELTIGALLFASDHGFRTLFGRETDPVSRIDLSAEVGRWVLSLRRQQTARSSGPEGTERVTRLEVEYPLMENLVARASREREEETTGTDVKAELDLELSYEKGKLNLGYALEEAVDLSAGKESSVRTAARASLEHAVGPIGKALAGFTIVAMEDGRETSSNVGVKYDFNDASLFLQYEILSKPGDVQGTTTAEVSIKF